MAKAAEAVADKYDLICLDVENWKLDGEVTDFRREENARKLISLLEDFRRHMPDNVSIGYYGIVPIRTYWPIVRNDQDHLIRWNRYNKQLRGLASKQDVLFPSLYTFYNNPKDWQRYAEGVLRAASQYGKPVYAFLWPQYHGAKKRIRGGFINGDFWKLQLETVYNLADGLVIWTPRGRGRTNWNSEADWWKATEAFLREHPKLLDKPMQRIVK